MKPGWSQSWSLRLVYGMFIVCIPMIPSSNGQGIIQAPNPTNVVDGKSIEFSCVALADDILYRVNETLASSPVIIDKGFIESVVDSSNDDSTLSRILKVIGSVKYNRTNITCIAVNGLVDISDPALLLVQGPLSSVVDLNHTFIDSSTVNVSWSPPFTLPGTDITGYNLSATSNGTTTNYFTSDSYYVLLLTDITDSPCNEIIITVSGYNGLDGENESLTGIYLPSDISTAVPVFINLLNDSGHLVCFSLDINVSRLCPEQFPTYINLTIQQYNGSLAATHNNILLLSADSNMLTTNGMISVHSNSKYTATITYSVGVLKYNSTLSFSTYAVTSVVILSKSAGLFTKFVCHFSPVLSAEGCVIRLSVNGTVQYESSGSRTINNTAVVSFCGVVEGVYELSAFDIDDSIQPSLTTTAAVQIEQLNLSTTEPLLNTVYNSALCPTTATKIIIVYTGTSTTTIHTTATSDSTIQNRTPVLISGMFTQSTHNMSTTIQSTMQGGVAMPLPIIIGSAAAGGGLLVFVCIVIVGLLACRAYVLRSKPEEIVENDYCVSTPLEVLLREEHDVASIENKPHQEYDDETSIVKKNDEYDDVAAVVKKYDDTVASAANKPPEYDDVTVKKQPQQYDDVVTIVHKGQEYDYVLISDQSGMKKEVNENVVEKLDQNKIIYADLNSMDSRPKARLQDGFTVVYSELQPQEIVPPKLPPRLKNQNTSNGASSNEDSTNFSLTEPSSML